jgi:hypothetical protein
LKILPLFPQDLDTGGLGFTLGLIERFGAFGAKTSQGQGVVRFEGVPEVPAVAEWIARMKHKPKKDPPGNQAWAPNILNLVGATIDFAPKQANWWQMLPVQTGDLQAFGVSDSSAWFPTAPVVRAMLRAELRTHGCSANDRHRLMGTIHQWGDPESKDGGRKDRTKGSDVFVTHLYRTGDRWRMRIFALVPDDSSGANRRVRTLLADAAQLKPKIAATMGLNQEDAIAVDPYPSAVAALLGERETRV